MTDRPGPSVETQNAALWLLVIAAALFSTELGSAHVADSTVAGAIGAVVATAACTAVVLAWRPHAGLLITTSGLCTAGAAAIHFAVTDAHFQEWWGYGLFFLGAGWAQLLWAVAAVRIHSRALLWIGLGGNASVVLLWLLTRTTGLPFGSDPGGAEPWGFADAVSSSFELVAAACCAVLLVRPVAGLRLRVPPLLVAAVTAALTTAALLDAASGHSH